MKTALSILASATVFLAPYSAAQSVTTPVSSSVQVGIPESEGEISPTVQLYVGRGDALSSALRFDAAAREYARAAGAARAEGHLASATSWKLATAFFYSGNLVGAAATLDQLANEAALVGDLEVEALAIYYAAWLGGKAGQKIETPARIARLEGLLRSKYMPGAIREQLTGLLRTSKEVVINAQ